MSRPARPLNERIWALVDASGDCWEWQGSRTRLGYGSVRGEHGTAVAHRAVYELLVGPIDSGLELDHLCRTPRCVNPDHLEPVTRRENNRRSYSSSAQRGRQTHCKNGHAFTPENTEVRRASGWRGCRICIRAAARRNHGIRLYAQRGRWVHSPSEIKELAALERGEGVAW